MKKAAKLILCLMIILSLALPAGAFAREGDNGYEGGISSGEAPGKASCEYQEVVFITGEPIVFKGTLVIKKSMKKDNLVSTYTYNLKNLDKAATLTRVLVLSTALSKKDNGQTVETTRGEKFSEVIKINNTTYTLRNYDFSRTNLIDYKPAINYYAGNVWGKKTYQIGSGIGAAAGTGTVTVEEMGDFYGYDQYWGSAQVMTLSYVIESEQKKDGSIDKWGGTADVRISSGTEKQLKYVENDPDQISFRGGYVQIHRNESVLKYSCSLPEFDQKGISTDVIKKFNGSLKLETFPAQTRLLTPDISHLRGHWAENDIKTLYSLEVFKDGDRSFNPEEYMSRAEFAAVMVEAAREVPSDPYLTSKTTGISLTGTKKTEDNVISSFMDVPVGHRYFEQIEKAYKRGLISGDGNNAFNPGQPLVVADALTVFIRALGLESLAPNPAPVTLFKDNDQIPFYARKAVYVAERIGLVKGDNKGYLKPNEKLTKGRAAAFVNRFINYMRNDIKRDYRERILNY